MTDKVISYKEAANNYGEIIALLDDDTFKSHTEIKTLETYDDVKAFESKVLAMASEGIKDEMALPEHVTAEHIVQYAYRDLNNVLANMSREGTLTDDLDAKLVDYNIPSIADGETRIKAAGDLDTFLSNFKSMETASYPTVFAKIANVVDRVIVSREMGDNMDKFKGLMKPRDPSQ